MYAFDVHCNAFFPMFLLIYVLQLALCPILLMHSIFGRVLSAGALSRLAAWLAGCLHNWRLAAVEAARVLHTVTGWRLLPGPRPRKDSEHPLDHLTDLGTCRLWAACFLAALFATGSSVYWYITFLGYSALPFLERTEV